MEKKCSFKSIIAFFKKYIEDNKILKSIELTLFFGLLIAAIILYIIGGVNVGKKPTSWNYVNSIEMIHNIDDEDYDEDSTVCDVTYYNEEFDASLIITYTYAEWEALDGSEAIIADGYMTNDGEMLYFNQADGLPDQADVNRAIKILHVNKYNMIFNVATSLFLLCISLGVILFFSKAFTPYEKIWFISIMVLATIISIIFPEESANGVSGIWIMLLYLLDTFFNILCELLISKQSRWNFIVSIAVEILEIVICIVLMYRFATMATTLFFWLPIDILSFINWSKHKDEKEEQITKVRRLKGWQEIAILSGIVVWTIVIGYILSGLNIQTDLFGGDKTIETVVCYLDACASAVGICNGLFIFFRFREQWIAWYICALLEAVINIMSGQYVLLVLKLGYITNTTYGYIKWTKYIKEHSNSLALDNKIL